MNRSLIIACYPGDLIWAKVCVGSLRMARTTMSIMILFDGCAFAIFLFLVRNRRHCMYGILV